MNKIKQIIKKVEEYEDNNCFELKTSVVLYWLNEIQKEAINYTHCCKSDSEQLKSKKCGMCDKKKEDDGHYCCEDCGGISF
jgi:hypothetical protein